MELLSDDVLLGIAETMLNPRERSRLAACNRRFHQLLPSPLRIKIVSTKCSYFGACLDGDLFVSPVNNNHNYNDNNNTTMTTTMKKSTCGTNLLLSSSSSTAAEAATTTTSDAMDIVQDDEDDNNNDNDNEGNDDGSNRNDNVISNSSSNNNNNSDNRDEIHRTLYAHHFLQTNQRYYLWKYDYNDETRVYLGRHLRQTLGESASAANNNNNNNNNNGGTTTSSMKYRYCLGFRPKYPNQSWKITLCHQNQNRGSHSQSVIVPFYTDVYLSVCGKDTRSGQPDSNEEQTLIARPPSTAETNNHHHNHNHQHQHHDHNHIHNDNNNNNNHNHNHSRNNASTTQPPISDSTWYVADCTDSIEERLQIVPSSSSSSAEIINANANAHANLNATVEMEAYKNAAVTKAWNGYDPNKIPVYPVPIYSIPDISDKGAYLYYSPESWKHYPTTDGRSAIIEFNFWIQRGYMYFRTRLLPFTLGIPIMKLDRSFFLPHLGAVANLFESYSARWGCIKYFMATAADVGEGCALNMQSFLRGVTDHEEHKVVYKQRQMPPQMPTVQTSTTQPGEHQPHQSNHHPIHDTTTVTTNAISSTNSSSNHNNNNNHHLTQDDVVAMLLQEQDLVYIDMQDEVDIEVDDVPRDDSRIYRFFFSW